MIGPGGTFGATLAANDRRLAEAVITLREPSPHNGFVNGHPMAHHRVLPGIVPGTGDAFAQLIESGAAVVEAGPAWAGSAELRVFEAPTEELDTLTVDEIIGGYFRQVGVMWNGGRVLSDISAICPTHLAGSLRSVTGSHTLSATEEAVRARLAGLDLDNTAMWAVGNIHRATTAIRNYLEQTVLRDTGLSWTGFVVMWVVWIWGDIETGNAAKEAGISKGTLTGVVKTLESYRYIQRNPHESDGRRVVLHLTRSGRKTMEDLFPAFNAKEAYIVRGLSHDQRVDLATSLRVIVEQLEQPDPA